MKLKSAIVHKLIPLGVVIRKEQGGYARVNNSAGLPLIRNQKIFISEETNDIAHKITYKADLWRRATDQEIDLLDKLLNSQTPKLVKIFNDSSYIDHLHPDFYLLYQPILELFGEERTEELLYPSINTVDIQE